MTAKLQSYNNITLFAPPSLFALSSQSHLTPRIEKVTQGDVALTLSARIGELSVEDPLAKELGL